MIHVLGDADNCKKGLNLDTRSFSIGVEWCSWGFWVSLGPIMFFWGEEV